MKKKKIIILILSLLFILFIQTIVYSAISSTMNIRGLAYSRVETDVRITNFSVYDANNAISLYEEFSKNTISTSIDFTNSTYIIYRVEVTNYGSQNVAIKNIEGLPSGLSYELINYTLSDKICDEFNKCNNFAKKQIYLKIYGTDKVALNLTFEFVPIWDITYKNLTGSYQQSVIDNESVTVNLEGESPKNIVIEENVESYKYKNNILNINNVKNNIEVIALNDLTYEYNYTGNYETFIVPHTGIYKVELWGASGNDNYDTSTRAGKGGYTSGNIKLTKGTKLYVYVGQKGQPVNDGVAFNNGKPNANGWTGGGSTDIRLVSGNWDNAESINSRIMVAAGGGTGFRDAIYIGDAGGLVGYNGTNSTGGTQIAPGNRELDNYTLSYFGIANGGCTSGNGYYPGGGAICASGSSGGSSYISGHNGCIAITSSSSTEPISNCTTGTKDITCSYHYSGYKFTNTKMIDGKGYEWTTTKITKQIGMPTFDGTGTILGNENNGFAKITYVSEIPPSAHTINFIDLTGNYPNIIYSDEILKITLPSTITRVQVIDENNQVISHTFQNNVLTLSNINKNIIIKTDNTIGKDLSSSNYNLNIVGATYTDKGLYFDGTNDYAYLDLLDFKSSTAFTLDFKAQLLESSQAYIIFETSVDSNKNYGSFYLDSNEFGSKDLHLAMKFTNPGEGIYKTINHKMANNIISVDSIEHYTISSDATKTYNNFIEMYKNNENLNPQPYLSYTYDYSNIPLGNYPLYIGTRAGTGFYTPMYLEELRIYNKALTQEEINLNSQGNIVEDSLIAYFKFK